MTDQPDRKYLEPTPIINSDHPTVVQFALETTREILDPVERAVRLYYAVRDGIWYDPYYPFYLPEHYRASNVLESGRGYCVCKAALLCAVGRACDIPTRIGFTTVRNHLATRQLIEFLGSDLFVYHGFTEFYLERKWVKATPAFNVELCQKHEVRPLEFNGREDSIFQPYNQKKKQFIEYVIDHGTYSDVPVPIIVKAWEEVYGTERVGHWIAAHEEAKGTPISHFDREEIWKGR
jgi:transglutaminase-like putative cysteine protease